MASRSISRKQIIALSVSGGLALILVVTWVFSLLIGGGVNPFVGASLYTYPSSAAADAVKTASGDDLTAFQKIADTPTAIWLTPEQHATSDIAAVVRDISLKAEAAGQLPVFVVYGIPDRDCDSESAGGTTVEDYPNWVGAIASGLTGAQSVVILEPDSLALTGQCGDTDARVAEIKQAVGILANDDTTIYLDGGHSTWLSADTQADLLNRAGVSQVRGFASNVSNYNATADEIAYDTAISAKTGGAHFVIDTGRNGNGTNNDWCNPTGRALGEAPAAVDDGTAHDANLWIKNPGESDGECNGGPSAGTWWPEGAVALATN